MKFLTTILFLLTSCCATAETIRPQTTEEFAKTSVRITNTEQTHGGSGVILESTESNSLIMTNRHVCGLLEDGGGVVVKDDNAYPVVAYKASVIHDICVLVVDVDLGVNTVLASEPPKLYSKAYISGHPSLFPHVLTKGDFSGKMVVPIQTGSRPCTQEEVEKEPMMCFFEGWPIIVRLEGQLVSATIAPGSSGSAVFNEDGEIAGLAFASNSRELGYALIVPYEYIANFRDVEAKALKWNFPKTVKVPKKSELNIKNKIYTQPYINDDLMYNTEAWKKFIEYIQRSSCQCSKKH